MEGFILRICNIIAHRGANQYAPQNTIPAFQKALELGADGLETDVHVTLDGELVLCHDYTVDKTSDGQGFISKMTFSELRSLDFGAVFSEKFKGTTLPSLDEFLELSKSGLLRIMNIELKSPKEIGSDIVRKTLRKVSQYGIMDKLLISSFDTALLSEVKKAEPSCKTALLYPSMRQFVPYYLHTPIRLAQKLGVDAVHPHYTHISAAVVRAFHELGIRVNPWTVNTPAQIRKMLRCGVDGIITDRPDTALQIADTFSAEK